MTNDRSVKKLYEWKPISRGLPGRPKTRWKKQYKRRFKDYKDKTHPEPS